MTSRCNFFRKTALFAGAAAFPAAKVLEDDPVQTTATTTGKLPFKTPMLKMFLSQRMNSAINSQT